MSRSKITTGPWRWTFPTISYDSGGVCVPRNVTGGSKGPGTLNVNRLFVAGVEINGDGIVLGTSPLVFGVIGDSKAASSNASIGSADKRADVSNCWVWNPVTGAWRDAMTLDVEPYDTANGNDAIAREIAISLRLDPQYATRPIYIIMHAEPGTTIWDWHDRSAAHGEGPTTNTRYPEFRSRLTAAFATPQLAGAKLAFIFVSLNTNNGGTEVPQALEFNSNIISQIRQVGHTAGTSVDLPILWLLTPPGPAGAHWLSEAIERTAASTRNVQPISVYGLDEYYLDNVHANGPGTIIEADRTVEALKRIPLGHWSREEFVTTFVYPGLGAGGGSIGDPWNPPNRDGVIPVLRTGANADPYFVQVDAAEMQDRKVVSFSNRSSSGGILNVVPINDTELGYPDRIGFFATAGMSIPIHPGEEIEWRKTSATRLELHRYSPARQHYLVARGNNNAASVTYAVNDVITDFAIQVNAGITMPSGGVFNVLMAGDYMCNASMWALSGSGGFLMLQFSTDGGTNWDDVHPIANGNAAATWGRNMILGTLLPLNAGDRLRLQVRAASVVLTMNNIYARFSLVRLPTE